jgi:hypothetical protein
MICSKFLVEEMADLTQAMGLKEQAARFAVLSASFSL